MDDGSELLTTFLFFFYNRLSQFALDFWRRFGNEKIEHHLCPKQAYANYKLKTKERFQKLRFQN